MKSRSPAGKFAMSASALSECSRLEFETRILSCSLRTSLYSNDLVGIETVFHELSKLYPELLADKVDEETNYYELLDADVDSPRSLISAKYHKKLKDNLEHDQGAQNFLIWNAGTTLRNDRLRLSHDLNLAYTCLAKSIDEFGQIDPYLGMPDDLPLLLLMLKETYALEDLEIQGVLNRSEEYPDCSLQDLLAHSECISASDLQFYVLGEQLIRNQVITMSEFKKSVTKKKFVEPGTSWEHYFKPPDEPDEPTGVVV